MKKMYRKLLSGVLCTSMFLAVPGTVAYAQTPTIGEYSALAAFYEFLASPQVVQLTSDATEDEVSWDIDAIRHAQLIDFNNNGIPEMLLIVNDAQILPHNYRVIVVSYTEQGAQVVNKEYSKGNALYGFGVSSGVDGRNFLVFAVGLGTYYFTLEDGIWENLLSRAVVENLYTDEIFPTVNYVRVSEEYYISAPQTYLGTEIELNWFDGQDLREASVSGSTLLEEIAERLQAAQPIDYDTHFGIDEPTEDEPISEDPPHQEPADEDAIGVTISGHAVVFEDQAPVVVDGRTLVPVRGVFESLGFDVDWDEYIQTAILTSNDFEVLIPIDSDIFTTNGEAFSLDVPAQIIGGRTMLPIRAVLESVGYQVYWDEDTRTVLVVSRTE